ncbi:MAG TPA: tetratricopeptide repeat protein, partial [Longimicrobiales bacterium]|nr:tetratricopeptide repeat protein [Longimicrobiales bacterium]
AQDDVPPERRGRWMALIAVALAAVFLLALAWVLVRGANADYDDAVAAFRAGRLDSAAVAFEGLVRDQPENVTALLYLGRIHRRQGNPEDAAEVLRRAAGLDSRDPDVRRELGHLFMDLQRPEAAVAQYERALEQDPDELRNWAGLIRAMRASGDPRAEALLSEAPADVQALLARPDTPTQGRD